MGTSPTKSDKDEEAFWATYGRFIYTFSQVEQKLLDFLWQMAGAHPDLARVVFQSARFGDICSTINKIYESRGINEDPLYRRAVDQLGYINKLRNNMVHLPSSLIRVDDIGLIASGSNKLKAMPKQFKEYQVKESTLQEMCDDMHVAMACIAVATTDTFDLPPDARIIPWRSVAQTPWRYKPPPQSENPAKLRKPRQGR
jgi:hypothetical protein